MIHTAYEWHGGTARIVAPMTLGRRIRELREQRGLTQEQLGDLIGKDQNYVSQLERGTIRMPHLEVLDSIARVLGTTRYDLLKAAGWIEEDAPIPDMAEVLINPRIQFFASIEGELGEEDWQLLYDFVEFLRNRKRQRATKTR